MELSIFFFKSIDKFYTFINLVIGNLFVQFPKDQILRKIILVGESSVGKTSIRKQYMGKGFKDNYLATIGADFSFFEHKDRKFSIWDIAGEQNYNAIRKQFYAGASGAIVVFDITRPDTFDKIKYWIAEIKSEVSSPIPFIFVGNKEDLRDEYSNTIKESEVHEALNRWELSLDTDIMFYFSSAKTGLNIQEMFDQMIDLIEVEE